MNELKQKVIKTIEENRARLLETADFLLKNPELGYCEYKTSAFVISSTTIDLCAKLPPLSKVNWKNWA